MKLTSCIILETLKLRRQLNDKSTLLMPDERKIPREETLRKWDSVEAHTLVSV